MYRIAGFWLLLMLQLDVNGQLLEFSPAIQKAFESVQRLDVAETKFWIEEENKSNPQNHIVVVVESYQDFFKAFIGEEPIAGQIIQQNKARRLAKLGEMVDSNPLKKWALANVYLHSAASRSKFGEHYSAALELRKAYLLLKENEISYPDFIPNKVSFGFLLSLLGSIPPQYQWVMKLASMEGNVKKGSAMLYEVLEKDTHSMYNKLFRAEALFFLTFIESNLNPDKSAAWRLLTFFTLEDNRNPLLMFAKANMEMRIGKNDAALKTISEAIDHQTEEPMFYLYYVRAEALIRKLDMQSKQDYETFISNFKGTNYTNDASRKLAWLAILQGDTLAYKSKMKNLLRMKGGQVESDKQAMREAAKNRIPHVDLLKARLLFDGGYYLEAESALSVPARHFILLSDDEKLEYYYRMGRIKHALEDYSEALRYYQLSISQGKEAPEYYAANAALLSGEIFELKRDYISARKMYDLSLSIEPEEYSAGIHAKARAGLNRIDAMK